LVLTKRSKVGAKAGLQNLQILSSFNFSFKTGFARDSGHERTFSKLQKEIQVPWKLPKQKDFYVLINGSFNQNRISLRSNYSGGFGHKWRRHLMTQRRWRRK